MSGTAGRTAGAPRVLAVLNLPATAPAVLRGAALLAARVGGTTEALHARPADTHIPGEEILPLTTREAVARAAAERSAGLAALAAAAGLPFAEEAGVPREAVAAAARDADFVVIGQAPFLHYEDAWPELLGALVDAGAPVLLMPEAMPEALGARIAVAWKPGPAAERAVAAAMPLLGQAEAVTVLMAGEGETPFPAPAELLGHLAWLGIPHSERRFHAEVPLGLALVAAARAVGADLLVMGAYSHGRLREVVFGGATRDVLESASLPVLLRH
jgi:nucleotide-binding universal stress UspA family protein